MVEGAILITGAAGLVGNAVRRKLEHEGREVIALDIVTMTDEGLPLVVCGLTEVHRLHAIAHGRKIGGIIHCGAFSGPMVARENPPAMVDVNIVGTTNVLELARILGGVRVVYCSSTSAYGPTSGDLIYEHTPLSPTTVYGASKAASELLVSAYAQQYGVDGVNLRLSWVFGPRRTTDCIIREMITDALVGRKTSLDFGADFPRQFIYVEDAAKAIIAALDRPALPRRTYNVTGDTYLTFAQVADTIRSILPAADIDLQPGPDPVDDRQAKFSTKAARDDFGYEPSFSFEAGVRAYVDWLLPRNRSSN